MIREQLSAALFNNTQVDLMRELFCEKKILLCVCQSIPLIRPLC